MDVIVIDKMGNEYTINLFFLHTYIGYGNFNVLAFVRHKDALIRINTKTANMPFIDEIIEMRHEQWPSELIQAKYYTEFWPVIEQKIINWLLD